MNELWTPLDDSNWTPEFQPSYPSSAAREPPRVALACAADIVPVPIKWLWPGWLACGKLHILGGSPGTGKTTLAIEMAAIVTRGDWWPDGKTAIQGNVVIWSGEDDWRDTLVPRLIAAQAEMSRVFFVGDRIEEGKKVSFDPARDVPLLKEAIFKAGGVNLLIIDPIVSAVQGDSHKNSETRRALQPLVDLANETGAALLGITHFSKGTGGRDPLERINGSLAFGAMARIVMIAAKPLPQEGNQHPSRIFMRAKSNIGCDEGGHEYDVHQIELDCHPGVITTQVAWGKPIEGTAREFLAEAETVAEGDGGALCDAETFLRDLLAQGAQSVQDVKSAAAAHGHSWRTIERAKKAVNVAASKSGKGGWQWSL